MHYVEGVLESIEQTRGDSKHPPVACFTQVSVLSPRRAIRARLLAGLPNREATHGPTRRWARRRKG
eukprot:7686456-Pyramimonas_sp.AAC.1